jgi:hypothetical protein
MPPDGVSDSDLTTALGDFTAAGGRFEVVGCSVRAATGGSGGRSDWADCVGTGVGRKTAIDGASASPSRGRGLRSANRRKKTA